MTYLSAQTLAARREQALDGLLTIGIACLDAGERMTELLAASQRDTLHDSRRWLANEDERAASAGIPLAEVWIGHAARTGQLFGNLLQIADDTRQALIDNAATQARQFDSALLDALAPPAAVASPDAAGTASPLVTADQPAGDEASESPRTRTETAVRKSGARRQSVSSPQESA